MKVAIVVPIPWESAGWTFDIRILARAFRDLGCSPTVVCRDRFDVEADFPVRTASAAEMENPSYWRTVAPDFAYVFTWLGRSAILASLREAGVPTLSRADTDGMVSIRTFPRAQWNRMVLAPGDPIGRARAAWHWLRRWTQLYRAEEAEMFDSLLAASVVLVETEPARRNIVRWLTGQGKAALAEKLAVMPHPVHPAFLAAPVPPTRERHVIAVGRWYDAAKDAALLARGLERYLESTPNARATVVGRGGEGAFLRLRGRAAVRITGVVPQNQLPALLGEARMLLMTSRWEGSPSAASEALCMGCSVVGTDLPGLMAIPEAGPFGRTFSARTSHAVASALREEDGAWESGERQAETIAGFWRHRLDPRELCAQMLRLSSTASVSESGS